MKKKGFILLEVSFGIVFASAAILGFFSFLNHLNFVASKTLDSIEMIESLPIYYSSIVLDKNSKIENFENEFLKNINFDEVNVSEFPNLKNFKGIFIKNEKTSNFCYLNYNIFLKSEK